MSDGIEMTVHAEWDPLARTIAIVVHDARRAALLTLTSCVVDDDPDYSAAACGRLVDHASKILHEVIEDAVRRGRATLN